jgi:anti-anti-sigma factor
VALGIQEETVGEVRTLALSGRLDTDTSADLELAVQDLLDAGASQFVIDLTGVGYVSSAGLRVLLMLGKKVDGKGGLRLSGLNPTVRQVFDVAGFTQLFAIYANRDAALAGGRGKAPAPRKENPLISHAARLLRVSSAVKASSKAEATHVARVAAVLGVARRS